MKIIMNDIPLKGGVVNEFVFVVSREMIFESRMKFFFKVTILGIGEEGFMSSVSGGELSFESDESFLAKDFDFEWGELKRGREGLPLVLIVGKEKRRRGRGGEIKRGGEERGVGDGKGVGRKGRLKEMELRRQLRMKKGFEGFLGELFTRKLV